MLGGSERHAGIEHDYDGVTADVGDLDPGRPHDDTVGHTTGDQATPPRLGPVIMRLPFDMNFDPVETGDGGQGLACALHERIEIIGFFDVRDVPTATFLRRPSSQR